MKALHKKLVGKKDPPEVRAILKSTPLKIDNVEVWNLTFEKNMDSPWDEAIRFAERLGILAQHLSERTGLPVKDIAGEALKLADDRDIQHIDTKEGLRPFALAIALLADTCPGGKELKEWCMRKGSRALNRIFAEWDKAEIILSAGDALSDDVDDDYNVVLTNDAWNADLSFTRYWREECNVYGMLANNVEATGVGSSLLSAMEFKQDINLYLLTRGANDGVSERYVNELANYLTQPKDNLDGLPTTNDAWRNTLVDCWGALVSEITNDAVNPRKLEPRQPLPLNAFPVQQPPPFCA